MAADPPELASVVTRGDLRESLEALRDRLAAGIDEVDPRYVAPLAKQLADVLKALASMTQPEGSAVDEIAKRRAARRGSKVEDGSAGKVERGSGSGRARGKRGTGS